MRRSRHWIAFMAALVAEEREDPDAGEDPAPCAVVRRPARWAGPLATPAGRRAARIDTCAAGPHSRPCTDHAARAEPAT